MKKTNTPAVQRGRNRETRTKPGGGRRVTTVEICLAESEVECLMYLERERHMTPEEVFKLGLRYAGV